MGLEWLGWAVGGAGGLYSRGRLSAQLVQRADQLQDVLVCVVAVAVSGGPRLQITAPLPGAARALRPGQLACRKGSRSAWRAASSRAAAWAWKRCSASRHSAYHGSEVKQRGAMLAASCMQRR